MSAAEARNKTLSYRDDVTGLRGVAVALVLAYHLDMAWPASGGFLGVDMFLVISGFVVTRRLLEDGERFSWVDFLGRRAQRIVPASRLMLLLCVGAAALLYGEHAREIRNVASGALWSALGAANFFHVYVRDGGYFGVDAKSDPLLHLWSLSVEEQFYAVWPLFLLAAFRFVPVEKRERAAVMTTAICVALGHYFVLQFPNAGYFMLMARFSEFLFGVCAIFLERRLVGQSRPVRELACLLGLILVTGSILLIEAGTLFPGLRALPVTLGTMLIIGAGEKTALAWVLECSAFQNLGLVSYSLYLWHWPIIAFHRHLEGSLTLWARANLLMWSLCAATCSYFLVEKRVGAWRVSPKGQLVRFWVIPTVLVIAMAGAMILWAQTPRVPELQTATPAAASPRSSFPVVREVKDCCERDGKCVYPSALKPGALKPPRVLLLGDSQVLAANRLLNALVENTTWSFSSNCCGGCLPARRVYHKLVPPAHCDACVAR